MRTLQEAVAPARWPADSPASGEIHRMELQRRDDTAPVISRDKPGCLLFLIDQSASMNETFKGSPYSKAEAVAVSINETIYRLLANCAPDGEVWDYYHIGALGYGAGGVSLGLGGKLEGTELATASDLDASPRRIASRKVMQGGDEVTIKQPEWIDPKANGRTPMVAAIQHATRVIGEWAGDFPDSIPPIVMNLSDGQATDGHPGEAARGLTSVTTSKGPARFFNLQLTAGPIKPVQFPATSDGIIDQFARILFDVSSELPSYMVEMARGMGLTVADGARGFCCNADMATLVDFLDIGSRTGNVR